MRLHNYSQYICVIIIIYILESSIDSLSGDDIDSMKIIIPVIVGPILVMSVIYIVCYCKRRLRRRNGKI